MKVVPSALGEPITMAEPVCADLQGAPCVFKGCRGVYHAGSGPIGVVLCAPWGFEDLTMRKSWRLLAEAIAKAGFPCLRFDYPGTGNSLGAMEDIADVAQWTQSIGAAADFLRAYSGVKRFVFLGQSLGAALAVEAAKQRTDIAALLLIAPVVKGRSYARELSVTSTLVADKVGIRLEKAEGEGLNVLGFSLSQTLLDSLGTIDLTKGELQGIADAVVFDQADRKAGAEVSEHLKRNGIATRLEIVPPYHLMISDATTIQPLPATAAQIVSVLLDLFPKRGPAVAARVPLLPATLRSTLFKEEPLRFGDAGALHGTLCQPAISMPGSPAVIFLNRGLNAQIGWRRVSVDHARALAGAGFTSLRIDIAGLGESADHPTRPADLIYDDALIEDVRGAIDALAARGHERIALVGVCSGGYMALRVAFTDPRITDLVVVNAQRLVWNPNEHAEEVIRYGLRSMNDYVGDIKSRGALRKLIRSRKRIVPALRFLAKQSVGAVMARIPVAVRSTVLRHSMAARVSRLFSDLSARGTRVSLVYSDRDPGLRELRAYFGPYGRKLRFAHASVALIADADHNLTTTRASAWLLQHTLAFCREPAARDGLTGARVVSGTAAADRAAEAYAPSRAGGGRI